MKGKYGQEYRINRADLAILVALVNPLIEGAVAEALTTPDNDMTLEGGLTDDGESGLRPGMEGVGIHREAIGVLESASTDNSVYKSPNSASNVSLEPLAGLIRHLQEENRNLAGQLGFVQAQLQQARETVRMLQAPPPNLDDGDQEATIESSVNGTAVSDEVRRLKAELEQAQRRASEAEVLQEAQEGEVTERRPWWKFW